MIDLDRIATHVLAMLNANQRGADGTPSYALAVRDKARALEEVQENVLHAAILTGKAICETVGHPLRGAFIEEIACRHGDTLPQHYGDTGIPEITPFPGSTLKLRGTRKPARQIEDFRRNYESLYSSVNHNESNAGQPSDLAGFYDIVDDTFYFTGFRAVVPMANFRRTNIARKLHEGMEPVITRLALGLSAKEGDTSDGLFMTWYQQGLGEINQIRSGATVFQPVDDALAMRGSKTA